MFNDTYRVLCTPTMFFLPTTRCFIVGHRTFIADWESYFATRCPPKSDVQRTWWMLRQFYYAVAVVVLHIMAFDWVRAHSFMEVTSPLIAIANGEEQRIRNLFRDRTEAWNKCELNFYLFNVKLRPSARSIDWLKWEITYHYLTLPFRVPNEQIGWIERGASNAILCTSIISTWKGFAITMLTLIESTCSSLLLTSNHNNLNQSWIFH